MLASVTRRRCSSIVARHSASSIPPSGSRSPRSSQPAQRIDARRAVAFAGAIIGEAALLSGDLALAATELTDACALHHELGADGGEAHCLQRLAEVRLADCLGPCRSA